MILFLVLCGTVGVIFGAKHFYEKWQESKMAKAIKTVDEAVPMATLADREAELVRRIEKGLPLE